ncbi:hypothetical protein CF326_g5736 [Tilletia indica]|nr:hypothetical protein CF326_g5736 [Tilletia indica]
MITFINFVPLDPTLKTFAFILHPHLTETNIIDYVLLGTAFFQADEVRVQLCDGSPSIWSSCADLGVYINNQLLGSVPVVLRDTDIIAFPRREHDLKTAVRFRVEVETLARSCGVEHELDMVRLMWKDMREEDARAALPGTSSDTRASDFATIHTAAPPTFHAAEIESRAASSLPPPSPLSASASSPPVPPTSASPSLPATLVSTSPSASVSGCSSSPSPSSFLPTSVSTSVLPSFSPISTPSTAWRSTSAPSRSPSPVSPETAPAPHLQPSPALISVSTPYGDILNTLQSRAALRDRHASAVSSSRVSSTPSSSRVSAANAASSDPHVPSGLNFPSSPPAFGDSPSLATTSSSSTSILSSISSSASAASIPIPPFRSPDGLEVALTRFRDGWIAARRALLSTNGLFQHNASLPSLTSSSVPPHPTTTTTIPLYPTVELALARVRTAWLALRASILSPAAPSPPCPPRLSNVEFGAPSSLFLRRASDNMIAEGMNARSGATSAIASIGSLASAPCASSYSARPNLYASGASASIPPALTPDRAQPRTHAASPGARRCSIPSVTPSFFDIGIRMPFACSVDRPSPAFAPSFNSDLQLIPGLLRLLAAFSSQLNLPSRGPGCDWGLFRPEHQLPAPHPLQASF